MTDETTSEQLAEIEGQVEDTPATEYTPPDGWRVVRFGEQLLPGDVWVSQDGTERRSAILHWDAAAVSGGRCIRRIEPEPQPQPEPVQVREGRWRTRDGNIRNVTPTPAYDSRATRWPWRDAKYDQTWREDGGHHIIGESPSDLVEYLGPIELEPQPEPQPQAATIEELRSEVAYVQNLLGESRQRVTQLEELVSSLRTINETQEKAFEAAGKENTALRNQLAAVKAELATVAADRQQLRVELDAAQQVPADSPEIRQLRADLAEVTRERDQYLDSYQRIFGDLETIRETTKAAAVEAIAEWLEPIRLVDHLNLSNETLQHLPQIMRHLTGLDSHAID